MRRTTIVDDTPEVVADARRADDAVRSINHRTIRGDGGLELPSDLEQTIGVLAQMVAKLPQALSQLARIGEDFACEPGLYDDRGFGPRRTVTLALTDLDVAIRAAERLAAPLARAAGELSHLGIAMTDPGRIRPWLHAMVAVALAVYALHALVTGQPAGTWVPWVAPVSWLNLARCLTAARRRGERR